MDFFRNLLVGNKIDFVGKRVPAAILSAIIVLVSWALFFGVGPKWGIDFSGGTEVRVAFEQPVSIEEMRGALTTLGVSEDSVQQLGAESENRYQIRIQDAGFGLDGVQADVEKRLRDKFGADWIESIRANVEVGARFSVTYKPSEPGKRVSIGEVAEVFEGQPGVRVSEGREEYEIVVAVPGLSQEIQRKIESAMGDRQMEVLSVESVGPKVGADLAQQGAISVLATLILILAYVAFRFDIAFAPGAVLALFHDVSVTIGIFILLGREFNLPLIGALLTIVGYSLNDTIVIYDRVRENMERYRRSELAEIINVSVNETLGRTFATSFTTLLAISAFLFIGGSVIQDFALAMLCGITFGTYSTVYVASPMILVMQDLKPMLGKMIVSSQAEMAPATVEGAPEEVLTETEKRRRLRADLEKQEALRKG